jgi:mannan endo-1,4-beta-mannosidase
VTIALAAASGCSLASPAPAGRPASPRSAQSVSRAPAASCGRPAAGRYLGLSVPRYSLITPTDQALGITANVASFYHGIGQAIDMSTIDALCARHVLPIIEIDTDAVPMTQIASGSQDSYLRNLARQFAASGTPVGLDLDHEFNGPWWAWGFRHATPAQFVAAWRHVVGVFRANGATDVLWIWNPSTTMPGTTVADLGPWYPGDDYVNWVGLDGYFYSPAETYASVFGDTISQVRAITGHPMIIMETGANPASGRPRAIASLFQGAARTPGLLGLIYFDYDKSPVHDWYLNDDPSARAVFKSAAAAYLSAG